MDQKLGLPLVPVFLTYVTGLVVGHFSVAIPWQAWIVLWILLTLWISLMVLKRARWGSWVAFGILFLLGIFSIQSYLHPKHSRRDVSAFNGSDRIVLEGTIDRPPDYSRDGAQLFIRCTEVILSNRHIPVNGFTLLFLKEGAGPFHRGDRYRFTCKLYSPRGFRNPGGFSYERHLAFERIYSIGYLSEEQGWVKLGAGFGNPVLLRIEIWRDHLRDFLEKENFPPSSSLLKALVLGERGDIPEEVQEHFVATGTAHLLAISGDQFGIVALLSFSSLLWVLKRSEYLLLSISVKKWAAALTIPLILLYTFIAGGGISVIRAAIMVIVFFLSILFDRERNLLHTLVLAAFLILIFSPPSLFDVSFQLSFLAVLSILYIVPRFIPAFRQEDTLSPRKISWQHTLWKYIRLSLVTTLVATLGTAPFVALHFNRISLIGFVTNLVIIPWVGFLIVPLALAASLFSFFIHPLASLLIHLAGFITGLLLQGVALFASFPFASLYVSTPTLFEMILFYLLLFLTVHLQEGWVLRCVFLGLCLLLIGDIAFWNVRDRFEKHLTVTFLDVGQGDSILVEFPQGKRMLIDGGGLPEGRFDIGKNVIAPFLREKKIRRIDYLVLTHADPDHILGLNFIASTFSIGQFWHNGLATESEAFLRLEKTLSKRKIERLALNHGVSLPSIHGVQLSVFNPLAENWGSKNRMPPSLNNHSLVLKLQFKDVSFLLAGDIEKEAEYRMVRADEPLKADVLKIPHHGSASSSTPFFLEKVRPAYAILSVGERNIGRLPNQEVLRRYQDLGCKVFRTDRQGAITVAADGEKIGVTPFLNANP